MSKIEDYRDALVAMCQELSARHEDLVFWKHLDRGLSGLGDFDTFSQAESLEGVTRSIRECAFRNIPGVKGVVCCSHLAHARLNLIVVEELYPRLLEIDVGSRSTRLGVELFDATLLRKHSCYTGEGIRKLKDGAQAVVLVLVHMLSSGGHRFIKEHDYDTVISGLRDERDIARQFWDELLVSIDNDLFEKLCDSLLAGVWPRTTITKFWWLLFRLSFTKLTQLELFRGLVYKFRPLCSVRKVVVNGQRVAQQGTWQEFLTANDKRDHRVYR